MSFEMPIIVLLLAANALWYLVGWAKGFNEGNPIGRDFHLEGALDGWLRGVSLSRRPGRANLRTGDRQLHERPNDSRRIGPQVSV